MKKLVVIFLLSLFLISNVFSDQGPISKIKELDFLTEPLYNSIRLHVTLEDNNEYCYTTYLETGELPNWTFKVIYTQLLFALAMGKNVLIFYQTYYPPNVPSAWSGIKIIERIVIYD